MVFILAIFLSYPSWILSYPFLIAEQSVHKLDWPPSTIDEYRILVKPAGSEFFTRSEAATTDQSRSLILAMKWGAVLESLRDYHMEIDEREIEVADRLRSLIAAIAAYHHTAENGILATIEDGLCFDAPRSYHFVPESHIQISIHGVLVENDSRPANVLLDDSINSVEKSLYIKAVDFVRSRRNTVNPRLFMVFHQESECVFLLISHFGAPDTVHCIDRMGIRWSRRLIIGKNESGHSGPPPEINVEMNLVDESTLSIIVLTADTICYETMSLPLGVPKIVFDSLLLDDSSTKPSENE